jgi:hypothetical protein
MRKSAEVRTSAMADVRGGMLPHRFAQPTCAIYARRAD